MVNILHGMEVKKLTDNNMTIVHSRKGKEAIILSKEAKPSVSKLISRSDDMQIKSYILGKVKSLLMLASSAATSTTTKD